MVPFPITDYQYWLRYSLLLVLPREKFGLPSPTKKNLFPQTVLNFFLSILFDGLLQILIKLDCMGEYSYIETHIIQNTVV